MTYKPKRNPQTDTYQNNPGKFSSNGKNKLPEGETEYFLKNGRMRNGIIRELYKELNIDNYYKSRKNKEVIKEYISYPSNEVNKQMEEDLKSNKINLFLKKIEIVESYLKYLGINIINLIGKVGVYVFSKKVKLDVFGLCITETKSVFFEKGIEDTGIFYHELGHVICEIMKNKKVKDESNGGYKLYNGNLLDESFSELFRYGCIKNNLNNNSKIDIYYSHKEIIITISKLIDLASKKIDKSPEYIYKYMMRGYIIKGYKGLNLFYQAFGKNFLKGIMELGIYESDEIEFIKLIKNNYDKLGFSTQEEAVDYFDPNNKPSQEIGDIMGIER